MEITSQELKQKIESGEKFIVDMYANCVDHVEYLDQSLKGFQTT